VPDAQLGALTSPCRRQRLEQIIKLQRGRLAPSQDGLDDVWRDQGKPQDSAQIRIVDLLCFGQFCRGGVFAALDHLPPAVGADDGLDQGAIDARCWLCSLECRSSCGFLLIGRIVGQFANERTHSSDPKLDIHGIIPDIDALD
jgi:hypothetical protein